MAKSESKKAQALAALLESSTLTEAAEKAQISRKTLYMYMKIDTEFSKAYKAAQDQLILEQMESLTRDRERARTVILAIMEDEEQPAAIRLKAAQSIFAIAEAQQRRSIAITDANANRDWTDLL